MISLSRPARFTATLLIIAALASAQEHLTYPALDRVCLHADLYGQGTRGLLLVHGGRFNKESWAKQARLFGNAGFRVLAIDFRGYGQTVTGPHGELSSDEGRYLDVLAAARYLHQHGADTVSVIGGSMGGDASAEAAAQARPGEIDRLVLLALSA